MNIKSTHTKYTLSDEVCSSGNPHVQHGFFDLRPLYKLGSYSDEQKAVCL